MLNHLPILLLLLLVLPLLLLVLPILPLVQSRPAVPAWPPAAAGSCLDANRAALRTKRS